MFFNKKYKVLHGKILPRDECRSALVGMGNTEIIKAVKSLAQEQIIIAEQNAADMSQETQTTKADITHELGKSTGLTLFLADLEQDLRSKKAN